MNELLWTMLLIVTMGNNSQIKERVFFDNLQDCQSYAFARFTALKKPHQSITLVCAIEDQA
jgi:hypothetical protein